MTFVFWISVLGGIWSVGFGSSRALCPYVLFYCLKVNVLVVINKIKVGTLSLVIGDSLVMWYGTMNPL